MRWLTVIEGNMAHVVPVADLHPHFYADDCPCTPVVETINQHKIFVHNSYDGREVAEKVREYLSPKVAYIQ